DRLRRPCPASPQREGRILAGGRDQVQRQRRAVVMMPDLVLAYAVQRREVARLEQVVDGGREGAVAVESQRQVVAADGFAAAVGLAIPAAFGMAGEGQFLDPVSRTAHSGRSVGAIC